MIGSMQLGSVMMNYARYTEQKTSGKGQVNSFSGVYESKSAASVDAARTEETTGTEKVSLESMLKAKYPMVLCQEKVQVKSGNFIYSSAYFLV